MFLLSRVRIPGVFGNRQDALEPKESVRNHYVSFGHLHSFAAKFRPAGLPAGTWKALEKILEKHQWCICRRDQQFWFKQENRPLAKGCESVEMHTQTIKKTQKGLLKTNGGNFTTGVPGVKSFPVVHGCILSQKGSGPPEK